MSEVSVIGAEQKGLAFAAFLKLLVLFIVVIPGIAAVILAQQGVLDAGALAEKSDRTYGQLMALALVRPIRLPLPV